MMKIQNIIIPNQSDIDESFWYSDAIKWAASNELISGVGDNLVQPDRDISREQFVVILYRYAQRSEMDVSAGSQANFSSYRDASEISEYATSAFQWACEVGIIKGSPDGFLYPQGNTTRAEAAQMLLNFSKLVL